MSHLQLGHLNCNLPRRSLGFYPIEETFAGANTNNSTQAPSNEIVSPNPPPPRFRNVWLQTWKQNYLQNIIKICGSVTWWPQPRNSNCRQMAVCFRARITFTTAGGREAKSGSHTSNSTAAGPITRLWPELRAHIKGCNITSTAVTHTVVWIYISYVLLLDCICCYYDWHWAVL